MSKARVSVIIPTYNYAAYLPYAIDSVLHQDNVEVDVVIIDDGSTDNTAEIAARYDSRVSYFCQTNAGPAAARTAGISHAEGDFLVFLDADDLLTPNVLASQVATLDQNQKAGMAVCFNQLVRSHEPGGPLLSAGTWPLFKDNYGVHLCHFNIMPIHAAMVRKEVAAQIGTFDHTLRACEDHDFWLRCAVAGHLPVLNPDGIVLYRKHGLSLSDKNLHEYLHNVVLHERIHALLMDHPNFPIGLHADAWIAHAAGCLVTAVRLYKEKKEISGTLLALCAKAIKQAAKTISLHRRNWNRTHESDKVLCFYALRALDHLDALLQAGETSLAPTRDILIKLFPEWNLRSAIREQKIMQMVHTVYCRQPYITDFTSGTREFEKYPHEALHLGTKKIASPLPRISIVMATFNAEQYLERALCSIEAQQYSNCEAIVQDGGSTDGTLDILKRHAGKVDFVSEPDHGVYDAWNKALARLSGEWALFLGADDFFPNSGVLADCALHLAAFPDDVVFAYGVVVQLRGKKVVYVFDRSLHEVMRLFPSNMGLPFPATFIRVPFLKAHGFDASYRIAGDFAFAARHISLANTRRLPVHVTYMEEGGLSASPEHALFLLEERKRVLREEVLPRSEVIVRSCIDSVGVAEKLW